MYNWHIPFLCNELQEMAGRVFRREPKKHDLIINVPPGTTKSTICSVMFPVWCWTVDQRIRSICTSYSSPLSYHLAYQSRTILQSEKYQRLYPDIHMDAEGVALLKNKKGGERFATSTGGSTTGFHGHFLIVDDPIDPLGAKSRTVLDTANTWMDETLLTRKVDKAVTPLVLIMQRLAQNDPTGHQLEKKGDGDGKIRHICLPCWETPDIRPRSLRKHYVSKLMDPIRLSREILKEVEGDLGQYAFAGQFLQAPAPPGGGMFKVDMIEIEKHAPKNLRMIRYWDKAGTGGGGAYTVGLKMGKDSRDVYWILDVVRGQWDSGAREAIIRQTAEIDGGAVLIGIEQEPGSGGKESAQNTVKSLAGFRIWVDNPTGNKVSRADPFSVFVNRGLVKMVRAAWNRPYLDELQMFGDNRGEFKDQVDASSGAFQGLVRGAYTAGALAKSTRR